MRVLLIEDDSGTAKSIELMLKAESFNIRAGVLPSIVQPRVGDVLAPPFPGLGAEARSLRSCVAPSSWTFPRTGG